MRRPQFYRIPLFLAIMTAVFCAQKLLQYRGHIKSRPLDRFDTIQT